VTQALNQPETICGGILEKEVNVNSIKQYCTKKAWITIKQVLKKNTNKYHLDTSTVLFVYWTKKIYVK